MTLFCAICLRPIKKKDVEAKRYVRSRHTGSHYCLDDARHDLIRERKRKAAA